MLYVKLPWYFFCTWYDILAKKKNYIWSLITKIIPSASLYSVINYLVLKYVCLGFGYYKINSINLPYTYYFKVKSAKPTINTTPPKTYGHLLVKFKKRQVGQLNYIVSWPPDVDISVDNYQRKTIKNNYQGKLS